MKEYYFLVPILSGIISQITKFLIESLRAKKIIPRALFRYGGMPSSHAAVVSSLLVIIYALEGASSGAFILSVAVAFFIIRDALHIRMKIEKQSKAIASALEQINNLPGHLHLKDRFGHTPSEIIVGLAIGIFLSFPLVFLFP